jgi:putative ABC transport system permease protein
MAHKTSLAWFQLIKEKTRLLVAIAGIGFADMLMFVQLGFQDSLFDSATQPHRLLEADLVMINPQFKSLTNLQAFSRDHLAQTLANPHVQSTSSLYINIGQWENPETRLTRAILLWGVEPDTPSFTLPALQHQGKTLKLLNHVFFDQAGRPEYGAIAAMFKQQGSVTTELNRQTIQVSGLVTMGSSFVADGNVFMSDSTFLKLYRDRPAHQIDVGLIHLKANRLVTFFRHTI